MSLIETTEVQTVITGTRWRGTSAIDAVARMKSGDNLRIERDRGNRLDAFAISCFFHGVHVGFLPRAVNAPIARAMDLGSTVSAVVEEAAVIRGQYVKQEPKIRVMIGGEPQL